MSKLRAFLLLGRLSNLPTVWSNCLAAWLLGGGGEPRRFALLCAGATAVYVGGMFLNDAFDVEFDRRHRAERPIPCGAISAAAVWRWGFGFLGGGLCVLLAFGSTTAMLAGLLVANVLLYDAVHKRVPFSPVLMAGCRFFLFLVAGSVADDGVTGLTVWTALVLAAYVAGLSYFARQESTPGALRHWPCVLLAAPLVLAYLVNADADRGRGWALSAILTLWVLRCLRCTLWAAERNLGRTVSGLLAGIVLVDLVAVAGNPIPVGLSFLLLFGAALLFQRFIPAT